MPNLLLYWIAADFLVYIEDLFGHIIQQLKVIGASKTKMPPEASQFRLEFLLPLSSTTANLAFLLIVSKRVGIEGPTWCTAQSPSTCYIAFLFI